MSQEDVRGWLEALSLEEVCSFLYKLQNLALVIRLDVGDAKDAFKLFETINNRGLKLSPTDIIKNFVLGNAARFGRAQLEAARASWAKLVAHLDGTDSDAFFRYYLITELKQRVTKSEVVPEFKWLFMNKVAEAADLPDRHLYSDEEDEEDEDGEGIDNADGAAEDGARDVEKLASIHFKDIMKEWHFVNNLLDGLPSDVILTIEKLRTENPGFKFHLVGLDFRFRVEHSRVVEVEPGEGHVFCREGEHAPVF